MIKMRIKNVCVGMGPIPSMVVLTPISTDIQTEDTQKPEVELGISSERAEELSHSTNMLPIYIGTFDAAAIALSSDEDAHKRPKTHDLLANTIEALGGTLKSVALTRVEGKTFYATITIETPDSALHHIDARPSDAIALALRKQVDILAEESLLEQAGSPDFDAIARDEHKRELSEFHTFLETLSPEDFTSRKDI